MNLICVATLNQKFYICRNKVEIVASCPCIFVSIFIMLSFCVLVSYKKWLQFPFF
uniref:Uncharacterized protein n=1 Tax=Rhizophora mucronata TaxID=61149 RepID=A0A2P2QVT3_RHIMU